MSKFWQFRNQADGDSAELILYGDISNESWYGDEVTPRQFSEELDALGDVRNITVRINSGGGDVFAAQTIGNRLEQHKANVTAKIDGLCASAATIIACHCDKVVAANDSIYMVHPVRMGLFGYANEAELNKYVDALRAIRDTIVSLYARKTGRDKEEVGALMDNESWLTGEQAKDEGFVDELTYDVANSYENRNGLLFVNSIGTSLPFDNAPSFVKEHSTASNGTNAGAQGTQPGSKATAAQSGNGNITNAGPLNATATGAQTANSNITNAVPINTAAAEHTNTQNQPLNNASGIGEGHSNISNNVNAVNAEQEEEEEGMAINSVEELRSEYPELVNQIIEQAQAEATNAERARIRDIEEMSLPGSEEITNNAKFVNPMSTEDYAKAVIKDAKAKGMTYLNNAAADAEESGANGIQNAAPQNTDTDAFMDAIKAAAKNKRGE